MLNVFQFLDEMSEAADRFVANLQECNPAELGLDPRSADTIHLNEDVIAVTKQQDRTMQYYGGFEYVDKDYRYEMGDWVFYTNEDDRVAGHIDRYYNNDQDE